MGNYGEMGGKAVKKLLKVEKKVQVLHGERCLLRTYIDIFCCFHQPQSL